MARGRFRSLKVFNYRVWAVGSLVSNVGTWMQRTAQDWLVLTEGYRSGSRVAVACRPARSQWRISPDCRGTR
jgi:hypothetical protein